MTEYKSKYINKTWNEITTSFYWVNCQPINCRISHHKKTLWFAMFRMSQNVLKFI
ncbi:hypothetical protein [Spiroplasma endosymbiont of Seladonia tumulorum]|uniref:hypothetical protein n=1 Tax=Spiroplasma endosymbiont of Seladonia tumulorum TaxID=3066321 RepID=UPI0030CB604C